MIDIDTDELKAHAPLIPYVEKHYKKLFSLHKRTANAVFCKCIWHEENTASLAFFKNGTYKCFGCGEHGDIITLVQKLENLQFKEACKMIGDNVGYEIIIEEPNPAHEKYKDEMDEHAKRYHSNLKRNNAAQEYLLERGIKGDIIEKFMIGLTEEEYKYRNVGGISNRISFPIYEHKMFSPKCIGFGYRTLNNDKPKYLNDPNQEGKDGQDKQLEGVFIKGDVLYGYPFAVQSIKKNDYIILTEGYMDVLSLHQSGITNSVGLMGVNISDTHIKTIKNITNNVMLFFDGDTAGDNATEKELLKLYEAGLSVVICNAGHGNDPADMCKALDFNYFAVNEYIKHNTEQSINFIINKLVQNYEYLASTERMKALKKAQRFKDAIKDTNMNQLFMTQVMKRLDIN